MNTEKVMQNTEKLGVIQGHWK